MDDDLIDPARSLPPPSGSRVAPSAAELPEPGSGGWSRRTLFAVAAVGVAAIVLAVALLARGGGDDSKGATATVSNEAVLAEPIARCSDTIHNLVWGFLATRSMDEAINQYGLRSTVPQTIVQMAARVEQDRVNNGLESSEALLDSIANTACLNYDLRHVITGDPIGQG